MSGSKCIYKVSPGSMGLASFALKLFPHENVNVGSWATPIWILCTEDEIRAFVDLANEFPDKKEGLVHTFEKVENIHPSSFKVRM